MRRIIIFLIFALTLLLIASCSSDGNRDKPSFPTPDGVIGLYADIYTTINYDLHFYKGELDENMNIVGDGYRIFFEMLCPDQYEGRYELPVGNYLPSDGIDMEDWSFARGELNGDRLVHSQVMILKNSVKTATAIVNGLVNVARTGERYTITVDAVLPDDKSVRFVYKGAIDFEDMNP